MGYAAATQPLQLLAELISNHHPRQAQRVRGSGCPHGGGHDTDLGRVHSSTVLVPQRVKAVVFCPADHTTLPQEARNYPGRVKRRRRIVALVWLQRYIF